VTALAAILGGYLAGAFSGWETSLGGFSFGGLQLLFLISAIGRLSSLLLLWRVAEPRAVSIGQAVRVLRRFFVAHPTSWLPKLNGRWTLLGTPRRPAAALAIAGRVSPEPASVEATTLSAA
ncbi:MAG: hypothetical protein ACREJM_16045, partial [Candidatus Saccharimonadales bacterium]